MDYILLILGIVILVKGADYLVDGSSVIAKNFGIPSIIVGLTIVAFGTSVPDVVVSLMAAINGQVGTVFGNVVGSNIANILLILGIVVILKPLNIKKSTVLKEILFSLLATVVLFVVSNNLIWGDSSVSSLTKVDGFVLLMFFGIFIYFFIGPIKSKKIPKESFNKQRNVWEEIWIIVMGIIGLYLGGKWVVESASSIALSFGVSEFLIASTVIAVGTSLPELITSVKAVMRNESDLALGNIIGSNIFNIFGVLGITFAISPVTMPKVINVDILFLMFVTTLLFSFMFIGEKHKLKRWQGVLFLVLYAVYITFLVLRG